MRGMVHLAPLLGVPVQVFGQRLVSSRGRECHDRRIKESSGDVRQTSSERVAREHQLVACGQAGFDDFLNMPDESLVHLAQNL